MAPCQRTKPVKAVMAALLLAAVAAPAALANMDPAKLAESGFARATGVAEVMLAGRRGRELQQTCADACKALPKMPVCGVNKKTYDNACYPACAGAAVAYLGKCASKPCLCAPLWGPVCGGGKSYTSSCFAKCAGVSSYKDGICSSDVQCPSTKAPVCGLDGKTYDNWCKAIAASTVPYYSGACDSRIGTCKCTTINDPVCVTTYMTSGGMKIPISVTYPSPCLAQCQGGAKPNSWTKGACKADLQYEASSYMCGCSAAIKPVCGQYTGLGNITATLASKCSAECFGYKVLYDGICKNEIICPTGEPVCVGKKTYKSACFARASGATTWTKGSCTPCSKCPAAAYDTYVCGNDGVSYGNECLATCVGADVVSKGFCGMPGGKRLA